MSRHRAPLLSGRQQAQWSTADQTRLKSRLDAVGLSLSEEQFDKVCRWASLLLQWNRTYNLLGAQNTTSLIDEHLVDSLSILPALEKWLPDRTQALVDVGTGAGFPGILIAIMQPERPIYLVEPIGKKVAFQRQSALTLKLTNVVPLAGKIEDLDELLRGARRASSPRHRSAAGEPAPATREVSSAEAIHSHVQPGAEADASAAPRFSTSALPPSTENAGMSCAVAGKDGHANGGAAANTGAGSTSHDNRASVPNDRRFTSPGAAPDDSEERTALHFICRAFTALDRFADLCLPFMSKQSLAFAMKAARLPEEQMLLSPALRVLAVEVIRTAQPDAQRFLAVMQRNPATPSSQPEPFMQIPSDSTHRRRQA